MRILNRQKLTSHGNVSIREDAMDIIDTGMAACDPYYNVLKLVRLQGDKLLIGNREFEAKNDPDSGDDTYSISEFEHIYVVGAGKGIQRIAKALEDILGEYLTGGHVICKHGDEKILKKIGITAGSHPTPDEYCIEGSKKIVEIAEHVTDRDLVFTAITNGGSSLLTLPVDGVELSDVIELTRLVQIEYGVPTSELNCLRNHIDQLKGGKILRLFKKATLINVAGCDLNHVCDAKENDFVSMVNRNFWLHNVPDGTSFEDAYEVLKKYQLFDKCPKAILKVIEEKSISNETLKYEEYKSFRSRIFGVMPNNKNFYIKALDKARELGYTTYLMSEDLTYEASFVGRFLASMAQCIAIRNEAIKLPAALIFTGELVVTVGKSDGVGGRNQECALAFADSIAGSANIVYAGVDTDGTDGPGGFMKEGAPGCLAGAIVDGYTAKEFEEKEYNIKESIKEHSTTEPLWETDNGIHAEQGISLNDLIVILIKS